MIKLFLIYFLFIIIPIFFTFIKFYLLEKVKKYTQEQRRTEDKIFKLKISEIYKNEREDLYIQAKELFHHLMQDGIINRSQVLSFKSMLIKSLGRYNNDYKKMYFKNDAHEIYTKMKSQHIDDHDWEQMINYLQDLTENTENVISLKHYRSKTAN